MATHISDQVNRAPRASTADCGNGWMEIAELKLTKDVAIGDKVVLAMVPAGILLTDIEVYIPTAVTGLAGTLGKFNRSTSPVDADNATAFAATYSMATANTAYAVVPFKPVKFNDDGYVTLTATAATTVKTSVFIKLRGLVEGRSV